MQKFIFFFLLIIVWSCKDDNAPLPQPMIPEDAVEIFDFETKTTHTSRLSLYAADETLYTTFNALLNGMQVDLFNGLSLDEAGYYELQVDGTKEGVNHNLFFQFTIIDSERGTAEWGLKKFTPATFESTAIAFSTTSFIYPKIFPSDLSLPFIFSASSQSSVWDGAYADFAIYGLPAALKRGVGSVLLSPSRPVAGVDVFLGGSNASLVLENVEPSYNLLNGDVSTTLVLEEGGFYHIDADLYVTAGSSIVIEQTFHTLYPS